MMVILPFEKDFYEKEGVKVDFVGHPLLDVIEPQDSKLVPNPDLKPVVALLPGSRKQEIQRMLPVMLEVAGRFPEYQFVVAGAPSRDEDFYEKMMAASSAKLMMDDTYALLQKADFALVTSGTATLETALHNVPEVVCYKGSWISFQIGKRLVNVKYISLVNLILDREAVTELIQNDFTTDRLEAELRLLTKSDKREQMLTDFVELRKLLGDAGASARAAEVVGEFLK